MVFAGALVEVEVPAFSNHSAAILVVVAAAAAADNSDHSREQNSEDADHFCGGVVGVIVVVATIPLADRPGY